MERAGKKNSKAKKPLLWIVLIIMAVIQIFPLVWLVDFSLASSNEMFTNGLLIIPEKIQWGNYVKAFVDGHFLLYLKNSVLINGLAVLLVILVSIMASFACRRMNWKLSGLVKTLLLMGMMIPIHATLLPNYKIYSKLGLTDTIWALLIPYVAFSLPQGLFLMTSFMESIPVELEEAAVMDGCGIYRIIFQIITPMLKSSIATVEEHYTDDISLQEVADKIGISAGYLSTMFAQNMNCKFVDYLNKVRIERACTYLEQNYLKTYEIAYRVGFRDEKYFSRVFKKVKGMSPKEYRTGNSQEPA